MNKQIGVAFCPTDEIRIIATFEKIEKCKHIKREGESCRLNNNCTYPDCKIETFNTKEK